MHHDAKRNRRDDWPAAGEQTIRVVDLEALNAEPVRSRETEQPAAEPGREARWPRLARRGRGADRTRRRAAQIPAELALLAIGVAFLVGALLKPWSGVAPAVSPTPNAPAVVDLATAAPAATSAPSLDPLSLFPVAPARGLVTVDWQTLTVADPHSDWGIAAATLSTAGLSTGSTPAARA